jgi:exopolysaccharide biosynthesis protein
MNTKKFKLYIVIIILFCLTAIPMLSKAQESPENINKEDKISILHDLRVGSHEKGVRIVLNLSNPPDFQIRAVEDSSDIFVDIFDADVSPEFKMPVEIKDKFLEKPEVSRFNFRHVVVRIPVAYGVPAESIRAFPLKNPDRIVIDIDRNFKKVQNIPLTKNIMWMQVEQIVNNRYTLSNDLLINHRSPDVSVNIELAKNSGKPRETVASMVTRTGAVAGINGGYFGNDGENLGLVVINGRLVAPSVKRRPPRTAFGIDSSGNVHFDRVYDKDGVIFTVLNQMWKDMVIALGGGPRLITNGQVTINAVEEALGKGGNDITRPTGRTALGVDNRGNLIMTTISSYRDNHKSGVQLPELANYLKTRNVVNAFNLDGGGSTEMSVLGTMVSSPPGGGKWKRPVTNAVLVYDKNPVTAPANITVEPGELVLPADGTTTGLLKMTVTDRQGQKVADGTEVSVTSGIGMIRRRFYPVKNGIAEVPLTSLRIPGNYELKIDCGPARTYVPVKFVPGETPVIITRVLEIKPVQQPVTVKPSEDQQQEPEKPRQFRLEALTRDSHKNPLRGKNVEFKILEGEGNFSSQKSLTAENGTAFTNFEAVSKRAVIEITVEGAASVKEEITW